MDDGAASRVEIDPPAQHADGCPHPPTARQSMTPFQQLLPSASTDDPERRTRGNYRIYSLVLNLAPLSELSDWLCGDHDLDSSVNSKATTTVERLANVTIATGNDPIQRTNAAAESRPLRPPLPAPLYPLPSRTPFMPPPLYPTEPPPLPPVTGVVPLQPSIFAPLLGLSKPIKP
jgi:hypothetical protein